MDLPFFRNYYDAPASPYHAYPSPAHSTLPTRQPVARVVSIPIHFVGSERSRSEAAVRIQKVLRGFLVRRAVKKIRAVWAEVGAMERRVEDGGVADGLRRDERERVRVNELLMGLLLHLDSLTGVDAAVKDCGKQVIRRVMALQERVDALVQEANDSETRDSTDSDGNHDSVVEAYQTMEARDHNSGSVSEDATMEAHQVVHMDFNQAVKECVVEEENLASGDEECVVSATQEAASEECRANGVAGERGSKRAEGRDLKEVMEKMVEENKKLHRMISELWEREVWQSRMMTVCRTGWRRWRRRFPRGGKPRRPTLAMPAKEDTTCKIAEAMVAIVHVRHLMMFSKARRTSPFPLIERHLFC